MGYQTIKDGIKSMLVTQGFQESQSVFDFGTESDQGIDRKFRILRPEIDLQAEGVEFLINLVRPVFKYKLLLGFKLAAQQETWDYDASQNTIDVVLSYFNNPPNYSSYAIKMKTTSVKTELVGEHLEVEIDLEVIDDITLT